jgi:predicted DCC family thiol-disulfide oxidoreductase YuxK
MQVLTTFYDGGCPLCSKEIAHYRRVDRAGRIRWVDITLDRDALDAAGLDIATAMRRLHVQRGDGRLVQGVPAFVAIWQQLPGYRLLARAVLWFRLTKPLDWAYRRFADWRFARRCHDGICAVSGRPAAAQGRGSSRGP